ncbi:hypothetical protein Pint_07229 [Pistacia integerrima]|uniref:Uncharacterized protein n=1 Tax=Pistacia integerrima TaxID=434235 RepID=A0ACC0XWY6_9ROSI|nr:hypothetical protein Pint_07229 [Pistacia integerrima]
MLGLVVTLRNLAAYMQPRLLGRSILGGVSDNTGSGIARRLVIKTGLNVILACNIPKNSPMIEVNAEKKLVEKLISLGYTRPKSS